MIIEGRTGEVTAANGSKNPVRLDKSGALIIAQGHPAIAEASERGAVFAGSTAVAGVAPGTVLSTTPPMCLLNPLNSGKNLAIIATDIGYVSGTLGAGSIVYAYVSPQSTIPAGGTELTPVNAKLSTVRGIGRIFQGSTLASTPLIVRPAYVLGAALATTVLGISQPKDLIDGAFIIPPATCFIMQGVAAAGTTPLVMMSITWEEIPLV